MDERELMDRIGWLAEKLPRFPDGRIDYSNSEVAPILTVFVKAEGEILLMKRGDKVSTYNGKWNTVAGYIDEFKPLRLKVLEELSEECGILEADISSMRFGTPYDVRDDDIGRTWIIQPVIVELKRKPKIKLDWEHTEYKWIKPEDMEKFDVVKSLGRSLESVRIF
ncbi:MAG: NUDIX domain-containing protein [Candidatus Altiarchaeota archaeon]|nr:NUDIX domain-containing protein [Candidatus Altiarchaeota archaeon]